MISATQLHATAIHFPIALLLASFLSELVALFAKKEFFRSVAFYLLTLATVGTIVAYLSGSAAGDGIANSQVQKSIGMHQEAALVTLWLAMIASLFRAFTYMFNYEKAWERWAMLILLALAVGSVGRTDFLGKTLAFKQSAEIEHAMPDFEAQKVAMPGLIKSRMVFVRY